MGWGYGLHTLQSLEPALGLSGFCSLGSESPNEVLHMSDFSLLFCKRMLLQGEPFSADLFESCIVAGIKLNFMV